MVERYLPAANNRARNYKHRLIESPDSDIVIPFVYAASEPEGVRCHILRWWFLLGSIQ